MRSVGSAIREAAGRCPPAGSQDDSYNARLAWVRTLGVPEETRLIRSALKVALLFAAHTYSCQPSRGSFEEAFGEVVAVLRELFDAAHELGPGGRHGEEGQGPGQDVVNLSQIVCTVRGDGFFTCWRSSPSSFISFVVAAWLAICNTVLNCLCIYLYRLIYSFPGIGCPYGGAARGARLRCLPQQTRTLPPAYSAGSGLRCFQ